MLKKKHFLLSLCYCFFSQFPPFEIWVIKVKNGKFLKGKTKCFKWKKKRLKKDLKKLFCVATQEVTKKLWFVLWQCEIATWKYHFYQIFQYGFIFLLTSLHYLMTYNIFLYRLALLFFVLLLSTNAVN